MATEVKIDLGVGQGTGALSLSAMKYYLVLKIISMCYFNKNETYLKRRGG